jgi:programmed cell death 6-interacting protein
MAVAKIPQEVAEPSAFIGDRKEFGRPLFAHLVPYAVHLAASIYEERRDRLVNSSIVSELEILTTKIHDALLSLNLPGSLQALEKPLGLPPSVLSHAEEIRQADAIRRLERSFGETAKLKASDEAVFNEGRDVLNAERIEDEQLRLRYGTERWTRPDSKTAAEKLYTQVSEIEGYLRSAEKSDNLVQTKYVECESMLRVLSGTNREIEEFVPSARRVHIPPKLEAEASKLRSRLNDVARMESRRRRKVESIQEKAKRDDINKAILEEAARLEREYPGLQIAPAQFEDFFEQRLRRYDPDIEDVRAEVSEQDQLLGLLAGANADFVAASKGDTSSKEREQALQKLESVYYKYKEIVSNLEVGRKFYNDLSKIVGRFMNDCKTFAYSRRTEAAQLEA